MKFISFNINGLRARPHQLEAIIEKYQPDVIGLQEIKVADEDFPYTITDNWGYHVFHHGQKGHYGVALLTKKEPKAVRRGFPTDNEDAQKRIIMADLETPFGLLTVINGYFPQGESRAHETKFPAKEKFYADLQRYLEQDHDKANPVLIMGDMNISPTDLDIGIGDENRKRWLRTGKCSFLPEEREWYQRLYDYGLEDTFRKLNPTVNDKFSWFDYRSKGFDDNRGLRIDHILVNHQLAERLFKILAQLTALPNVFFAGHFICNHQAKMHFYCEHDALLKETLQQLDFVSEINVQDDPNWDTYFDFLLASPLEMKLNATEEILSMLNSKGRNLSDTYLIEHTFHFDEEEKMFPFMDELTLGKVSFNTLKYSSQAIQTEEDEQPYFMVKLEQELSLDSNEIFDWVERFEKLAMEFSGDYIGWECDNLMDDRSSLN